MPLTRIQDICSLVYFIILVKNVLSSFFLAVSYPKNQFHSYTSSFCVEPALNDDLVHIFLGDNVGCSQIEYVIAVISSVLHLSISSPVPGEPRVAARLASCSTDLSRHFLGSLHDALTGCQVAVLTGHAHLSGQPFFGQGRNGLAGQIIVSRR